MMKILLGFFAFAASALSLHAIKPPHDTTYKIAVILPLHLHDYNGANVNRANIMLDYYHGFYLALKEYEKKGIKIKLYVYDNEHDTLKTKEILKKPELKKMGLIVAPILDEHLHIINHFSSKHQIAVLSPFTAVDSLFPNNPLFFNAAPARKTKAEFFYDYFRKTDPNRTVLIIKNEEDWNKSFGNELIQLLQSKPYIDYKILSSSELQKADSNTLSKDKKYVVFHSSEENKAIKTLTTFLDKQSAEFEIVGDYKPFVLKTVPESKQKKFNIKIISSDFINPADSATLLRDFKTDYRLISNLNPSRYAMIGHDQAAFICEMLLKNNQFKAADFTGERHAYYSTQFLFKKDRHCNQNKGLFILKISESGILEEASY